MAKSKKEKEEAKLIVLDFHTKDLKPAIKNLILSERIVVKKGKVFTKERYIDEETISHRVHLLNSNNEKVKDINVEDYLDEYLAEEGIVLEEKQREAVIETSKTFGGFYIIDGSAGCGKTFSLKIALKLIEWVYAKHNRVFESIIMAPTGKASKVAQKATQMNAATIHRGLRYNPRRGYFYNASNYLPYDCIILDESSMVDVDVARNLFEAISPKTKVIFLGDTKQLPSVGAGNVLKDLINSTVVKTITLNVVKRQGKDSGILLNANRIINGEMIESTKETRDSFVYGANDEIEANRKVIGLFRKLLKYYKIEEIQVLTPQKSSSVGTNFLNYLIQREFNPENNDVRFFNKNVSGIDQHGESINDELYFKKGDKVIHMKNDYLMPRYNLDAGKLILNNDTSGITNGETGIIVKIYEFTNELNETVQRIIVRYDNDYVIYDDNFTNLEHAFALTIHKSQGSQWDAVIIPIMFSSYNMLNRNLLYTGWTRAKLFASVVGEDKALKYSVQKEIDNERFTYLDEHLKSVA